MDDKDRVALVAAHVARLSNEVVLVPGAAPCIEVHSLDSWQRYSKRLSEAADLGPEHATFVRHVLGNAQHARLDAQGRVRIDDELMLWAKIPVKAGAAPREVLLLGVGNRVEVWLPHVWESARQPHEPEFERIRASLFTRAAKTTAESDEDDE